MSDKFHAQNLSDGKLALWRYGRAWWRSWRVEWTAFHYPRWSFHLGVETGGGDSENEIMAHINIGIAQLFISYSFAGREFAERELSIAFHDGYLWLKLWCDDDVDTRRPWHRNIVCLHVKDWITGTARCETTTTHLPGSYLVPMPEGCYRATAKKEERTWTYRFGIEHRRVSYTIDIPRGIPFEGKGESEWNCGPDGLCGTGGATLEEAIGNAVASVLESRRRYGVTEETRGRVVYARPFYVDGVFRAELERKRLVEADFAMMKPLPADPSAYMRPRLVTRPANLKG